jgi:uncharacterized protein (TIGR04255 family)
MENFPNAPIVEALFDIKVEYQRDINHSELESLHQFIKSDYPTKKALRIFQSQLKFKKDEAAEPTFSDKIIGYQFWSSDEKQVVQYKQDGFAYSRLKPYENWDSIFTEAKKLWEIYNKNLKTYLVKRIAVKYINLIEIPLRSFKLENYFTAPPQVSDGLPQSIENFISQITIKYPETTTKAIITMKLSPSSNKDTTSTIYDIDVFKITDIKSERYSTIWETFNELRLIKNDIFDKGLTENAKKLFR